MRDRILRDVTGARVQAALPWAGFALLGVCMAAVGGVPRLEVAWAAASVAAALLPSAWVAPSGWRRRGAEALLLVPALALVLVADPTMRRMVLPPLLLLPAIAAAAAALPRAGARARPLLLAALAVAVRAACGLGLVGLPWWRAAVVLLAVAAVGAAAARLAGAHAGVLAALLAGTLPLEAARLRVPLILLAAAVVALLLATRVRFEAVRLRGWLPGALTLAFVASALAPWGGIAVGRAVPGAGWPAAAAALAALALTPLLPGAAAGAAWLAASLTLGPTQPPPPDQPAVRLTADHPEATLPASAGGTYALDLSLANGAGVPTGAPVAEVADVGARIVLRAGVDAVEWAHERPDVRAAVAHSLPEHPVWRPTGIGRAAVWGVAGHREGPLAAGVRPRLVRDSRLPPEVVVTAAAAGSAQPTPPRDWPLPAWIAAAAAVVAVLQLAGRTWGRPAAWVPWALLATGSLLARLPIEPLRLAAERYGVDIVLAALLAAWLPLAGAWLRRGRVFVTAAALLVPLALGTSHLMPPGGDAQYHLIILRSLAEDHDLDLSNNYDLARLPGNSMYVTRGFLHSPVLAFVLLPGYLIAGFAGALATMGLLGAGVVAALARAAAGLGLGRTRCALLVGGLLLSYPLATFATQIWVEVPGALCAALAVLAVAGPRPRIGAAALASLAATTLKARLALATFPLPLVALVRRPRGRRELAISALIVGAAALAGLAFGVLVYGHPLGPFRKIGSLPPQSLRQPLVVLGGLAFDAAGGLLFSAPLLALALAGAGRLWRSGGAAGRGALLAGAVTVAALLNSPEWYGGGSPPVRYLVPLLPALALCAALLLRGPSPVRRLALALLPAAAIVWWALVSRPHLAFNPGDGGWWLADAFARRFSADARHLVPSFLRPSAATFVVPILILLAGAAALAVASRVPRAGRALAGGGVVAALLLASGFVLLLTQRTDRLVELEDPQVERIGGRPEPPPGVFSRFLHRQGWRVGEGEGVVVPLRLPAGARLRLEGSLEGPAQAGSELLVAWDGGPSTAVEVRGEGRGSIAVPGVPGAGRHRLRLVLETPPGGEAILDRVVVER